MNLTIAIVEDEYLYSNELSHFIQSWSIEKGVTIKATSKKP